MGMTRMSDRHSEKHREHPKIQFFTRRTRVWRKTAAAAEFFGGGWDTIQILVEPPTSPEQIVSSIPK